MRLAWLTDVRPEGLRAGTVETHGDRVCIANMYKRRAQPVSSPDHLKRDGDAATTSAAAAGIHAIFFKSPKLPLPLPLPPPSSWED